MEEKNFKPIEQITETELQELWPLIGGAPHLYEHGKDELKEGLSNGLFESLQMDYYTMAAIVDYLRGKGYEAGAHPSENAGVPPMRPEYHEQVEVNMAAGMPENEAEFQSGYTAGHDAGYEKGKREGAGWVKASEFKDRLHSKIHCARRLFLDGYRFFSISWDAIDKKWIVSDHLTGIQRDENKIEILDESPARSGKEEAVDYIPMKRWAYENGWFETASVEWVNEKTGQPATTAELYDIFKQSK